MILNEEWLTGGSLGLMDIPDPTLFGLPLSGDRTYYWLCALSCWPACISPSTGSPVALGRALAAIAQDEEAARANGIALARCKSKCFLVAAFTAGVAGGLFAYHALSRARTTSPLPNPSTSSSWSSSAASAACRARWSAHSSSMLMPERSARLRRIADDPVRCRGHPDDWHGDPVSSVFPRWASGRWRLVLLLRSRASEPREANG